MRILIIGKGGREHALAWKISQSNLVSKIYVAPGNPGTTLINKVKNITLQSMEEMLNFAEEDNIDITIVGSEELLVAGIVDLFLTRGKKILGPDKHSAILEGSKCFAKNFMIKYGVKTANYKTFNQCESALDYVKQLTTFPIVIKASGLAFGKGVIIANNLEEAINAIIILMQDKIFGKSGQEIVIEDYLVGHEASIMAITDGKVIIPLLSAKDHKKIANKDTGLNTGGMGVIAPNPLINNENYQEFMDNILKPTLSGIHSEQMHFIGVIFFGLMLTTHGVYLLEYNMRFGDPETQAVLPLLENDLIEVLNDAFSGNLKNTKLQWKKQASCTVVASCKGYPEKYETGNIINGAKDFEFSNTYLFVSGIKEENSNWFTNSGRVLNITAVADNLELARKNAYFAMGCIDFENKYIRDDIGVIYDK